MSVDLEFVGAHAGRPVERLTRRDVARALLAVPSGQALVALPELRRAMAAAGNPLSPVFWDSARATLAGIEAGVATMGDVQRWLESTGTEPILLTRSYFVWPEEDERGPVATEMYQRLVTHLEERVAAGDIDPDLLAMGDAAARRAYEDLQEEWLRTPLPDGRVPSVAISDEEDEELLAAWDAEESYALGELRRILAELPAPRRPEAELRAAAQRLRELLARPGYPGDALRACAGLREVPPADDEELWLSVLAGVAAPLAGLPEEEGVLVGFAELDDALDQGDAVLAALCAIPYADWLAAVAALVRRGPGVLASPERIARLVAESEEVDVAEEDAEDLETTEMLFAAVVPLWRHLGVVDEVGVLTPLGWWGLPRALERAWSPREF